MELSTISPFHKVVWEDEESRSKQFFPAVSTSSDKFSQFILQIYRCHK